jgi:predicted O-linked N-acetylglucosamine transferase (SPINDLY family)
MSPDLAGRHPVAVLASPLFRRHDAGRFEVVAYSGHTRPDETSALLRQHCKIWRDVESWSDDRLAATIRADRIDILVDLAGHTAGNRIGVLARRPASVQASFIGYPHSTGLRAVDALIADPAVCPPYLDAHCSETVVRLPHCFFCLDPDWSAVGIDPSGVENRESVVFGSFNNLPKLSPTTLDLWAAVLRDQGGARLRLRAPSLGDPDVRAHFRRHFEKRGIAPGRIDLLGPCGLDEMLRDYGEVDIALDPLPFNGGMTTLQALWMGVPVITLAGGTICSRMGASILGTAGLESCVARSVEEYREIARQLGADRDRLIDLRRNLRTRLRGTPLCDVDGYVRDVEAVYRALT